MVLHVTMVIILIMEYVQIVLRALIVQEERSLHVLWEHIAVQRTLHQVEHVKHVQRDRIVHRRV
jgi:hypothetical protein